MHREDHHGDPDQNSAVPQWKASHVMPGDLAPRTKMSDK
jgi:hypothetical protein